MGQAVLGSSSHILHGNDLVGNDKLIHQDRLATLVGFIVVVSLSMFFSSPRSERVGREIPRHRIGKEFPG